jgi:DNA-binding Xre family transcriptional regulator
MDHPSLRDIGDTMEVIASHGEPTVVVVPSRIWRRLPASLRKQFEDVDAMLRGGKITARLVPIDRFGELHDAVEDATDREFAATAGAVAARERAARARIGAEPGIPAAVMRAEIEGVHPIAAWRKHRNLTQAELASAVGIDRAYLALLERRSRTGSPETLAKIARTLGCLVEDLLEDTDD